MESAARSTRGESRRDLMDVAIDCFAKYGAQATSIDRIAKAAGATMGAEMQYYQDPKGFDLAATFDAFVDQHVAWLSAPARRTTRGNGNGNGRAPRRK